jgi:hypothetical protein
MRDFTVKKGVMGYIVTIGCQVAGFTTKEDLLKAIGINKTMKKSDIIAIVLLNNALTEVTAERDKFMKAFIAASRDLQKAQKEIKQLKNQVCELNKVNT